MRPYYEQTLSWYTSPRPSPAITDALGKYAHIDFAIAVLFIKPVDFSDKMLPILGLEKNDFYSVRLIRRLAKVSAAVPRPSVAVFEPLIQLCPRLVKRALAEKDPKPVIRPLVRAFSIFPGFLRLMFERHGGFLELYMRIARECEVVGPQGALVGCFRFEYVEETEATPNVWLYIKTLINSLSSMYRKDSLYANSRFLEAVPEILRGIADFLLVFFQQEPGHGERWISEGFEPFSKMEAMGLIFLASPKKDVRSAGISIIASVVEMVHVSDAFETFRVPVDNYQDVVTQAHSVPTLSTGHPALTSALRVIPIRSDGTKDAWDSLFDGLLAMTQAINPKVPLPTKPDRPVLISGPELSEAWMAWPQFCFPSSATTRTG
jgi:hypothetical protein